MVELDRCAHAEIRPRTGRQRSVGLNLDLDRRLLLAFADLDGLHDTVNARAHLQRIDLSRTLRNRLLQLLDPDLAGRDLFVNIAAQPVEAPLFSSLASRSALDAASA